MRVRWLQRAIAYVPLAVLLLAGTSRHASAQADQPSLTLELASEAPAGFDAARLQRRVAVYLDAIVAIAWVEGDEGASNIAGAQRKARFVARLEWPQGAMTPLHVQVTDLAASPEQSYELDVVQAQSWEEVERLLALKLGSTLRTALAQPAPQVIEPKPAPQVIEPKPERAPATAAATEARAVAELGVSVFTRSAFEAPRLGGTLRGAVQLHPWAFGVAASVSPRRTKRGAQTLSDALESSWAASVRYDLLPARSPWLLQIGAEAGLFVARVEGSRAGRARTTYAVSPLTSVLLLGGVQLTRSGSAALSIGPALDLLWNRSEVRAGGVRVYDTGRLRPRADLRLTLAF